MRQTCARVQSASETSSAGLLEHLGTRATSSQEERNTGRRQSAAPRRRIRAGSAAGGRWMQHTATGGEGRAAAFEVVAAMSTGQGEVGCRATAMAMGCVSIALSPRVEAAELRGVLDARERRCHGSVLAGLLSSPPARPPRRLLRPPASCRALGEVAPIGAVVSIKLQGSKRRSVGAPRVPLRWAVAVFGTREQPPANGESCRNTTVPGEGPLCLSWKFAASFVPASTPLPVAPLPSSH
ncbi:hypothetical protein CC78DRAFT_576208 [Lojkania enalia]|uniref:Uncharacterized protein n=1 Tax=Lojkania enalia TaxID=147567 RepID=A0A9P4KGF5_9PLEO|nr:hypothetical protein CC78DRAFT_576208 [Didymosphaeria enalia]